MRKPPQETIKLSEVSIGSYIKVYPYGIVNEVLSHDGHLTKLKGNKKVYTKDNSKRVWVIDVISDPESSPVNKEV